MKIRAVTVQSVLIRAMQPPARSLSATHLGALCVLRRDHRVEPLSRLSSPRIPKIRKPAFWPATTINTDHGTAPAFIEGPPLFIRAVTVESVRIRAKQPPAGSRGSVLSDSRHSTQRSPFRAGPGTACSGFVGSLGITDGIL